MHTSVLFLLGLGCSRNTDTKGGGAPREPSDTSPPPGDDGGAADSSAGTDSSPPAETGGETDFPVEDPCPDLPADAVTVTLPDGFGHPTAVLLASGQVGVYTLATLPDDRASEQLTFGESAGAAYSPQPVAIELTISRCPGEITYDATDFCTYTTLNGSYNSMVYLGRAHDPIVDAATANAYGYCWAPMDEGTWYLNMRWTYTECAYGAATCGFMLQRNLGPY